MNIVKSLLFSFSCIGLAGCAATQMYDGPSRPTAEVSVIKGMNPYDPLIPVGWAGQVLKVDNKVVPGVGANVEILPGKHELEVHCSRQGAPSVTQIISLDAKAGMEYGIGVNINSNDCVLGQRKTSIK